jgi:hypothetical protein
MTTGWAATARAIYTRPADTRSDTGKAIGGMGFAAAGGLPRG